MLIDTSLLSETEQRFADRQTKREEGVRLIRAGIFCRPARRSGYKRI